MIWHDRIWYDIIYDIWHDMIWYMIWYIWHDMMIWYAIYDMTWYDMIWRHDMVWYDMTWQDMIYDNIYDMIYDMTWYDMAWHDMIWHDMIWYDMNGTSVWSTVRTTPNRPDAVKKFLRYFIRDRTNTLEEKLLRPMSDVTTCCRCSTYRPKSNQQRLIACIVQLRVTRQADTAYCGYHATVRHDTFIPSTRLNGPPCLIITAQHQTAWASEFVVRTGTKVTKLVWNHLRSSTNYTFHPL